MSAKLNRAIELFIGHGTFPIPVENEAPILDEYGAAEGRLLISKVGQLLFEQMALQQDWTKLDLAAEASWAEPEMMARHSAIDSRWRGNGHIRQ